MIDPSPTTIEPAPAAPEDRVWVVLPTYNEAENVGPMTAAILEALPAATVLVVDDGSPDGTGRLADALAAADPRIRVRHRALKQGLGRAYLDGFGVALAGGATTVVQMDADFSHDPAALPGLVAPIAGDTADLVIGSRYTPGGGVVDWGLGRRIVSRGGSLFARIVLGLGQNDLTGGFKAWRAHDPRGGPVRRGPCRRLRLPDRDDLPGEPGRRPDPRGADHLPRPTGRAVQDEPADRRRGAGRGRPASGRGAPRPPDAPPPIVTGPAGGRLGGGSEGALPAGVRVILDARPLQAPDRAPLAAAYLDGLLGAFDAAPLAGESFAFLIASDLDDPTPRFGHLEVVGRRQLPPTRLLRSGAMTVDPFVLRGAAIGSTWRAERGGAAGAVYHAVGGGPLPIASGLPVVVTLLDLAPWELPDAFQRSLASRFGQRLRAQLLREAAAVIVGSDATAAAARRLIRIRGSRLRVVPLAPRAGFAPGPVGSPGTSSVTSPGAPSEIRQRLGVTGRYLAFSGRFDARLDLTTLLSALARLARAGRPAGLEPDVPWPPRVLLLGATPEDRASVARAAARKGVGEALAYAPSLASRNRSSSSGPHERWSSPSSPRRPACRSSRRSPAGPRSSPQRWDRCRRSSGPAGLLVEPGDPDRLAVALTTIWADDAVHARLVASARERAAWQTRTWADVAIETRRIYAEVGVRATDAR